MLNVDQFLYTLPIMLKGMAGIFLVTGIIILSIVLLNLVTGKIARLQENAAHGDSHKNA